MKNTKCAPIHYKKGLPTPAILRRAAGGGANFILVYDEKLRGRRDFSIWASQFQHRFDYSSGESLKSIDEFARHVKRVLPSMGGYSPQENILVAVGGGSLGDFAGFMASVLKRGVRLVHIPSTWLAAVDSAHGSKNGLNVGEYKNQVGTFYTPQAVICVRDILTNQPEENVRSAYGEVLKMALLRGGALFAKVQRLRALDELNLWKILPAVVEAKCKIVSQDPLEQKGVRHLLNLGHTIGHVYELEHFLSHGKAVQLGMGFSAQWSVRRGLLREADFEKIMKLFAKNGPAPIVPLPPARFRMRLEQDKKAARGDLVRFVFIQGPGRPLVEAVKIDEIVHAAREMNYVR